MEILVKGNHNGNGYALLLIVAITETHCMGARLIELYIRDVIA